MVFEVVRTVRAARARVFAVVSDIRRHGDFIPLTTMVTDPGPVGPGWRFTGRSGVGPLVLVDRMEITQWDPGHSFRMDKRGPLLDGWAEVRVEDDGPHSRLTWREEIVPRPAALGRWVTPALDPANRWMFGRALDGMVRRAEQG